MEASTIPSARPALTELPGWATPLTLISASLGASGGCTCCWPSAPVNPGWKASEQSSAANRLKRKRLGITFGPRSAERRDARTFDSGRHGGGNRSRLGLVRGELLIHHCTLAVEERPLFQVDLGGFDVAVNLRRCVDFHQLARA